VAIDPVCQMEVDERHPPGGTSEYKGRTYYFCAPGCKIVFDRDPSEFAGAQDSAEEPEK